MASHQHKRPGQINCSGEPFTGNPRVGSSFASYPWGPGDQHIPRWTGRSALTFTKRMKEEEPQERPKVTAPLARLAFEPNR